MSYFVLGSNTFSARRPAEPLVGPMEAGHFNSERTTEEETMDKAKALVMAAFAADSLSLGSHWIYSPGKIADQFGRTDTLEAPHPDSFHSTKGKGAFTHYGDQMVVLLESVAEKGGFDLADFARKWRDLFDGYDGYFDGATKATLSNFSEGKPPDAAGSTSDDFAGASRIAPLVPAYRSDPDGLAAAAESQTRMTHNSAEAVETAAFFARVIARVLEGTAPAAAMEAVVAEHFDVSAVAAWVQKGLATTDRDTVEVVGDFGRSCHTGEMFPGVVHIIAKYENDLREAMVQSVMAAGDSAARGTMAAMVLGARHGVDGLPDQWFTEMKAADRIRELLEKLP